MASPLPYMRQLPQDYYAANYVPPSPSVVVPPVIPNPNSPVTSTPPVTPTAPFQMGGTWVGTSPPNNPAYGWMWLNSSNNGLYVYTDPGVWTQVGTNW